MYVHTYRYMSLSGTLIALRNAAGSCWPIQFYFPRGLEGVRFTTLRLSSVDERVVPPGLAELKQLHMESNNECSQHLQLHNSLA